MKMIRKNFVICSAVLDRIEACPASAVYVKEGGRDKPSFPMWYGIFLHRFLEYAKTRGRDHALDYIATKFKNLTKTCAAIDVDSIPDGEYEVPMAHNPFDDLGWRLPKRSYTNVLNWETEQFGKADFLAQRVRPMVGDFKSGEVTVRPENSSQLLGLQASLRSELKTEGPIDVALIGVRSNGDLNWHVSSIDIGDHRRYVQRTKAVHLRVIEDRTRADQGIQPAFITGPHCGYCELKQICPGHGHKPPPL